MKSLKSPFEAVRSAIAEVQGKAHFSPVFSGEWAVPEAVLKKVDFFNFRVHSVDECLELPSITQDSEAYERVLLLEETEQLLLAKLKELLAEGARAWEGQLDIVRGKEQMIRKEISRTFENKSEEQWVVYYAEHVGQEWSQMRVQMLWGGTSVPPPNASAKYAALFGYVKEEIQKIVHTCFEVALKEQEEARKRKEEELIRQQSEELRKQQEENRKQQEILTRQQIPAQKQSEKQATGEKLNENSGTRSGTANGGRTGEPHRWPEGDKFPLWLLLLLLLLLLIIIALIITIVILIRQRKELEQRLESAYTRMRAEYREVRV